MKNKFITCIFTFITIFALSQGKDYHNYSLYDVYPTERFQLKFLQSLENFKYADVVFWRRPYKLYTDIQVLVNKKDRALFEERLKHFSMKATTMANDIQELFDNQNFRKYVRMKQNSYTWNSYHNLEDVYQWMFDMTMKYPDHVSLKPIGLSAEGKEILALKIKARNPKAKAKVIVEAALNGDEWITTEFVTYLANQLIHSNTSKNARLKQVARKFNWIIIPIANPDGYVYSMKFDRMWMKNRRRSGKGEVGVNLNKNFDYNFCKHGGNNETESIYYCGPRSFSEPETQALSKFINKTKDNLNYYIAFHAYGQYIIIPYSDRVQHLDNFSEMENYGKQAIAKMYKLHGNKYDVGTNYDLFGIRESGDSVSWVKKTHNVKHALSFYLRDNGTYGHALPSEEILPTCKETMVGLLELMTARHVHGFDISSALIVRSYFVQILLFLILFSF